MDVKRVSSTVRTITLGMLIMLHTLVTPISATKIVQSLAADLSYDENNRLAFHVLAYEDSPACQKAGVPEILYDNKYFQVVAVEGQALHHVFPGDVEDGDLFRAACLDRGVERSLAGSVMPHMYYDNSGDFAGWFNRNCDVTEVCFMNYHNKNDPLNVYWLREGDGTKELQFTMHYGNDGTRCFNSFVGHKFQVEDSTTGEIVGNVTIEFVTVMAFGTSPPSGSTGRKNFDESIARTLTMEWKKHTRIKRTFSPLGFKKGRLPPDVYASLGAFYYNNRMNKVREEWERKGLYVNWWETDVYFIQIPWHLKTIYQARLLSLVEEWAGVPVEETMMYGLRQYESGARLLTHVDRQQTHAVSLIVNVAQGNLTEPWPVEVLDHMDRLHEVPMEPGDIVYYESAKALHGRNSPLMGAGAYYVNLFTHYRPANDPHWHGKPNPDGTPEPLMEVEGECKVVNIGTTTVGSNGQLGRVQCDDERLGPYVSPSQFTAKGPGDLVEWWRRTANGSSSCWSGAKVPDQASESSKQEEL